MSADQLNEAMGRFCYTNRFAMCPPARRPQVGEFWILWNAMYVDVIVHEVGERVVHFHVIHPHQMLPLHISGVYNNPQPNRRA